MAILISSYNSRHEEFGWYGVDLKGSKSLTDEGKMINWVETNLEGIFCYIHYTISIPNPQTGIRFKFRLESDAMAFKLRWQ